MNPFKVIESFLRIKERIDKSNECDYSEAVNQLVGTYQIDSDDAHCFAINLLCFNPPFRLSTGHRQRLYLLILIIQAAIIFPIYLMLFV